MLRLDRLARHCASAPAAAAAAARTAAVALASRKTLASIPDDRLEQAYSAFEAMSSMQAQQQNGATAAAPISGTGLNALLPTVNKTLCVTCHGMRYMEILYAISASTFNMTFKQGKGMWTAVSYASSPTLVELCVAVSLIPSLPVPSCRPKH
jgi:hypothetical protein